MEKCLRKHTHSTKLIDFVLVVVDDDDDDLLLSDTSTRAP